MAPCFIHLARYLFRSRSAIVYAGEDGDGAAGATDHVSVSGEIGGAVAGTEEEEPEEPDADSHAESRA